MIIQANTVVDPRTVVVEALHAFVTDTAVARTVGPDNFTVRAEEDGVKLFQHLHERDLNWLLEVARIPAHGDSVEKSSETEEGKLSVNDMLLAYVDRVK